MKALTVCQPYAHLIMRGEKRVENRKWPTSYRGPLYIHAGKSKSWLDPENGVDVEYRIPLASMAFGAVLAIAQLVDCVFIDDVQAGAYALTYPWLKDHRHTNGPWCWIIDKANPIGPWPWKGALGLFEIDEDELGRVANRELGIKSPA